jgi:protein subunit release factor B
MSDSRLNELEQRLASLGIAPEELEERFIRSGGPGGQHANKSSTAVQLSHPPTGLEVRVESERSQLQNRVEARQRLIQKVEAAAEKAAKEKKAAQEKVRRQNRRPSVAARKRMVEKKRKRSTVKRNRKRVNHEEE